MNNLENMNSFEKYKLFEKLSHDIYEIIRSCKDNDELLSMSDGLDNLSSQGRTLLREKTLRLSVNDNSEQLKDENEKLKQQLEDMKKEMDKMNEMKEKMKAFLTD